MVRLPALLLIAIILAAFGSGFFMAWDQLNDPNDPNKQDERGDMDEGDGREPENPELILIRAEIKALREELARPRPPWHRPVWLPTVHRGHVELPVKHYRLKKWIRHRTHVVPGNGHAVAQRRISLWMLVTGMARVAFWTVLIILVAFGLGHVAGFGWAGSLSREVWFVAILSIYANLATDFGSTIAAYAALVAADVHTQVTTTSQELSADIADLDADVHRLSEMMPGDEATALAAAIITRLSGRPAS